jgi:predicted dehydrogenase
MKTINIGVIGYGYWGPNLVRNFFAANDCNVKSVADGRPERLALLDKIFHSVKGVKDADDIINDNEIDAVVIATSVFSHFPLAKKALNAGKHVLIEKPMTASVAEADELIELAAKKGLTLMVDHTFLYTGAVAKMKELIDNKVIGTPRYFDSSRINLGLFQPDVNVIWDLAPHDLSILTYLVSESPVSINATGISHTKNNMDITGESKADVDRR